MQKLDESILLTAMQSLKGVCDGAREEDGSGFAGPDVRRGHRLAGTPWERWTGKDKAWAFHAARKYRKQLAGFGIDFETIPEPADTKTAALIDVKGHEFIVTFEYDSALVAAVKSVPGRRFNPQTKCWTAPISSDAVAALKNLEQFSWTEAATAMAETAESMPVVEQKPTKQIDVEVNTFIIRFDFDRDVVAAVKSVPGARFEPSEKFWTAPADGRAIARLRELVGFEWTRSAKEHADMVEMVSAANLALSTAKSADLFEIPDMLREPYPFQKAGILFGVKNKNVIIGDEPGLGKTLQGIGIIWAAQAFPALVVCPSSVTANWKKEILASIPIGEDQVVIANSQTTEVELKGALIVIIGQDILAEGVREIKDKTETRPVTREQVLARLTPAEASLYDSLKGERNLSCGNPLCCRRCERCYLAMTVQDILIELGGEGYAQ